VGLVARNAQKGSFLPKIGQKQVLVREMLTVVTKKKLLEVFLLLTEVFSKLTEVNCRVTAVACLQSALI
jgi:hypothetical protein